MTESKQWSVEEDSLLLRVFHQCPVRKWSHMAKKLQEEFGIKGRNGKQCKQRYVTFIDPDYPKGEWSYPEEQAMFELHNQLGNKWAIIGAQLNNRTDNSVKNHFYSRLRRALRKLNKVIVVDYSKDLKEFKPNILYRIVEVAEEKFKNNPAYQKFLTAFSYQLKNEMLDFSYDDFVDEKDSNQTLIYYDRIDLEKARELIDKLNSFTQNYKKKSKKQRRLSVQDSDLLNPLKNQFTFMHSNSENEESQHGSSLLGSSDHEPNSSEQKNKLKPSSGKRPRKCSQQCPSQMFPPIGGVRTRSSSQHQSSIQFPQKQQKVEQQTHREGQQLQQALNGMNIVEEESLPPHLMMMKKETSKYSDNYFQEEQFHFFEDSQIQMRILPEIDHPFRRDSQFEDGIFL